MSATPRGASVDNEAQFKALIPRSLKNGLKRLFGISKLQERMDLQAQAISEILDNIRTIKGSLLRDVRLFQLGEHYYFRFCDEDDVQRALDPATVALQRPPPQGDVRSYFDSDSASVLELLFCHHWMHGIDFSFIDVGANMGNTAIPVSGFFTRFGRRNHIHSFECGSSYYLLEHNVILNGFSDLISTYNVGISNKTGCALVYREIGHSEHERIVSEFAAAENRKTSALPSTLIKTVTLDHFIEAHNIGRVIVKSDTEGGDWHTIQGMTRTISRFPTPIKFEFAPIHIGVTEQPTTILSKLLEDFYLFADVMSGGNHRGLFEIDQPVVERFVDRVFRSVSGWTDIVAIPRGLEAVEVLLQRLRRNVVKMVD